MSTDKPDAVEPVEPTGEELLQSALDSVETDFDEDCLRIFREGRAFERAARERKRGEKPANPSRARSLGVFISHEPAATDWQQGFDAALQWADSGDSDELAALRAELAERTSERDVLAKELAKARKELRLYRDFYESAACGAFTGTAEERIQAHRAKPSPQSPSSADGDAQQTSPGGPDQGADNTDPSKTGEQSPPEEARNLSWHLPYETAPTLEKGVTTCGKCGGNGYTVYGASLRVTCYGCGGTGRVVRVESAPASKLSATLDRIEVNPPRGKVTEADGPLFIPAPADEPRMMGPLEGRVRRLEDAALDSDELPRVRREIRAERAGGRLEKP
jgi:hypothetical protein